jgi:hypothetical protein
MIVARLARALYDEHISPTHVISNLHRELAISELNGIDTTGLDVESLTYSLREERVGTACENKKWTSHKSSLELSNGPSLNY